jgi:hypothetical protein
MRTAASFSATPPRQVQHFDIKSIARNGGRCHGQRALGFDEGLAPVASPRLSMRTTAAAAAGVDELVVAQVDAGVADATATIGAEEQQIAWLELVARDQGASTLIISRVERGRFMPASSRNR